VPRVRFITRASTRFFSASLRRCARVSKPESMRSVCDWLLTLTTALKEPIASALADDCGLFWQVTPAKFFTEWVKDPAGLQRVTHEVWQMKKLDLAKLQKAFAGK
jgi:hypothetical protein